MNDICLIYNHRFTGEASLPISSFPYSSLLIINPEAFLNCANIPIKTAFNFRFRCYFKNWLLSLKKTKKKKKKKKKKKLVVLLLMLIVMEEVKKKRHGRTTC